MKKILIVDDDNIICVMAKHALEEQYQVMAARSGKEALDYLETETPELILMDIEMPEMDGKEAVRRIKAHEKWSKIPIVFLTADSNPLTEVQCLECGADDYITKPFVPLVMRSRVNRILEAQELRKELEIQLEKKTITSLTDALTGLHNRAYLEKELPGLLEDGHIGTLFMIDLDNFKGMNDTYGHIVGDKILQYFAEILKSNTRKVDIACRLAGDEFVVFYTDLTEKKVIVQKAENIIKMFAEKMGALGYAGIVSVSIGIKITDKKENFENLYSQADKSLYFVKNNGKNAYHFFDEQKSNLNEISTVVDLDDIRRLMLEGVESSKGAFHVAYDEFKMIYDYVLRYVARKNQKVQIVLFTLHVPGDKRTNVSVETAMDVLKNSVISSLRAVDTGTKYSSSQYMVILLDADTDNGKTVAERVINHFYQNPSMSDVEIGYDVQTIEYRR